jgi:alpha-galactosidase
MRIRIGMCMVSAFMLALAGSSAVMAGVASGAKYLVNDGGKIMLEFDGLLRSRVVSNLGPKTPLGPFTASECISVNGKEVADFKAVSYRTEEYADSLGKGKMHRLVGTAAGLEKEISIVAYDQYPAMLFYSVTYRNTGTKDVAVDGWTNNRYAVSVAPHPKGTPSLWSYQPGSYGWDNNWIIPLDSNFSRDNYLGMNAVDYGGGTPVADIWRPDCGVAVGHVEPVPKLVSLPVTMVRSRNGTLAVTYAKKVVLRPGGVLSTFRTFVAVHGGDYSNALVDYRRFMEQTGFTFRQAPDDAYGNEWCGWGFEQSWTTEQLLAVLPKVKELGLSWVVLDMGWYNGLGDFVPDRNRFPKGDEDLRKFVDSVHSFGLKLQLWWMPMAVSFKTGLLAEHPEYLIFTDDGSPRFMPSFFKAFFLCPASPDVIEFSRRQVARLMSYGVDGLKIDGNNLNCVPTCYNPSHHHPAPEASLEALPAFYKMVYETALGVNPRAKIEICPCGTNQSFYLLPFMNETVASDPHSSYQLRTKAKTLHALTGGKSVFYGDHVELVDGRKDFASTIGVGGTIGTKFVYPPGVHMNTESGDVSLTPEREKEWRKWIGISDRHPLARGTYRGELYDIGFDLPEAHAVKLGGTMNYAFFAPAYDGTVELRGLDAKPYRVTDYENGTDLGVVTGPSATLHVSFKTHLLLTAEPD